MMRAGALPSELSLFCDRLNADSKLREALAQGHFVLDDKLPSLSGDELQMLKSACRGEAEGTNLYFLDRDSMPKIGFFKVVSTLRPQYLSAAFPKEKIYDDEEIGQSVFHLDLGHFFWRQKLDLSQLAEIVAENDDLAPSLEYQIDKATIESLPDAMRIISSVTTQMSSAEDILFAYRVLQSAIKVVNRAEVGVEIHQSRGLVATDFNQYDLGEALRVCSDWGAFGMGRQLLQLFEFATIPSSLQVAVINLRNDGELAQALFLATILKARIPSMKVVLETAGANEQFDFSNWTSLFANNLESIGVRFDYFLPRQDYRASLLPLLDSILSGRRVDCRKLSNVQALSVWSRYVIEGPDCDTQVVQSLPIAEAFKHHIKCLQSFQSAGFRTILARLTPARCHWSACSFCTINTQHSVPVGKKHFDAEADEYVNNLIHSVRSRSIESIILMDEAISPEVLFAFAQRILDEGLKIIYRARSRFSDELNLETCKLLYKSGCRYLGMGLESAVPRVNAFVNKHHGTAPNHLRILSDLEDAGIRPHIYSIMGFPTETEEEINTTRDFLLASIRASKYVTVSANNFYLMRGSAIAKDPAKFGIKRVHSRGDIALTASFEEPVHARSEAHAREASQMVYAEEFAPFLEEHDFAEGFWHFIDQTGIFYTQKVVEERNPYRSVTDYLVRSNGPDLLDQRFKRSRVFWLRGLNSLDGGTRVSDSIICDWVSQNYAEVAPEWDHFVRNYDDRLTLAENFGVLLPALSSNQALSGFGLLCAANLFTKRTVSSPRPVERSMVKPSSTPMQVGHELIQIHNVANSCSAR